MHQYYVPDFEVKIQGLTMEADVKSAVISLTYDNNLDLADTCRLTLNNADLRFTTRRCSTLARTSKSIWAMRTISGP